MKNIHILPTDKPSRLYYHKSLKEFVLTNKVIIRNLEELTNQNIYITSDEEIKEPCWCWDILQKRIYWVHDTIPQYPTIGNYFKKIILTTDQDLIKDGVQTIPDEFLKWFVKNPSCEEAEVKKEYNCPVMNKTYDKPYINYEIIIPKEEPKQETLEEFLGKKTIEYCKQYVGTDKYNVAMLAIEFGYQLKSQEDEK